MTYSNDPTRTSAEIRRLQTLVQNLSKQNRTLRKTITAIDGDREWKENELLRLQAKIEELERRWQERMGEPLPTSARHTPW